MRIRVGLENGDEDRSVVWFLEYPGCFAYGKTPEEALTSAPQALREYAAWIQGHAGETGLVPEAFEISVDESWQVFTLDENFDMADNGYTVNAWFRHDWKPLKSEEVESCLKILSWSRRDLEEIARHLDREKLDRQFPGERWSIDGILRHVASAEWWYLDNLGLAFPKDELPQDTWERLDKVRRLMVDKMASFAGSSQVVGRKGEFWSPRKVLRRAAWHERDHTGHIRKLLSGKGSAS